MLRNQLKKFLRDNLLPATDRRLVAQVLSYDLTVGQGYAYGDPDYWQYLLKLADWKVSDPYYATGILPPSGPFPAGLDTETVAPKMPRY